MAKQKQSAKAEGKVRKVSFSEFNPCRPRAKDRPSERVYWVEELVNAGGRNYNDIFEKAATNWAKAMVREKGGDHEEYVELYKNNIPGTPSDTRKMLETLIPMVEKKFSKTLSYEFDEDGDITVEFTAVKAGKKSKAAAATATKSTKKTSKRAVKASDEDDEDEDEDEDTEDDEDEDEDED